MEAIWPTKSLVESRSSFYSAINRIRTCLYGQIVVSRGRQYEINRAAAYWWDVKEFQGLVAEAAQHVPQVERSMELYQRLVSIYRGLFLEEFYSDWCLNLAIAYEEQYCSALSGLGRNFLELGHYDVVTECCDKILNIDGLREDAVSLKIQALLNLGKRSEVARLYRTVDRQR